MSFNTQQSISRLVFSLPFDEADTDVKTHYLDVLWNASSKVYVTIKIHPLVY